MKRKKVRPIVVKKKILKQQLRIKKRKTIVTFKKTVRSKRVKKSRLLY